MPERSLYDSHHEQTPSAAADSAMNSRFDAEIVVRAAMLTEHGRVEIELRDSLGRLHVVSLPATSAVELGCLISDVSHAAPYMLGGAGATGSRKK